MKQTRLLGAVLAFMGTFLPLGQAISATIIIEGVNNEVSNGYPFGSPGPGAPYMGFIYANIPAFSLKPDDLIAFDTGAENDSTLQFNIALAATTTNGSVIQDQNGYTQIVNAGIPTDPNGDSIVGNYELTYSVDSAFNFGGGGLIIRFEPLGDLLNDFTNENNLYHSYGGDTSGYFVRRFYNDTDGLYPYSAGDTSAIANFQLTISDVPLPPTLYLFGSGLLGLIGIARKKVA